ncbi:MAG: hypothetical protein ACO1Q7_00555 [Gemmatimonas sp.]
MLLLAFATSCERNTASSTTAFSTIDSAGITIVTSTTSTWTDDTRWQIDSTPQTVASLESQFADADRHFIQTALRIQGGKLLVNSVERLSLFDSTGAFMRDISVNSFGIGAQEYVHQVYRTSADSIVAALSVGEWTVKQAWFDPAMKLVREVTFDDTKWRGIREWNGYSQGILPDGSWTGSVDDAPEPDVTPDSAHGPVAVHRRQSMQMYVVSQNLDTARAVGRLTSVDRFGMAYPDGLVNFLWHPLYAGTLVEAGGTPSRVYTLLNPRYEIEVWTSSGKLERIIRRHGARRVPTSQELRDAATHISNQASFNSLDSASTPAMVASAPPPDSLPAATELVIASTGEILVMREGTLPSASFTLYDVFAPNGGLLGELRLPKGTVVTDVGQDFVVLVRYRKSKASVEVHALRRMHPAQ